MCSSARTKTALKRLVGVAVLGATLSGCSDIYYDRRDTIALGGGDAVATNNAIMIKDPWPRSSANRNIAFNGERVQMATDRYRQDKIKPPINVTTSSTAYQAAQAASNIPALNPTAPSVAAAPVK
jgi:hypothetical protein